MEEEDLSTAALKRDPKKETIPDELATSEGGKEETEAEKKRRKKAKKAKMKERQRSKQQGAEGKDRDEEGEEDDAEEDAEEKRGAQVSLQEYIGSSYTGVQLLVHRPPWAGAHYLDENAQCLPCTTSFSLTEG